MRLSITISLVADIPDEKRDGLKSFHEIAKNYYQNAKYEYPDLRVESCFVYDLEKNWLDTEKGFYTDTEEMEEEKE